MPCETFLIEIEGDELSDVYADMARLEVELDEELAAMARLQLPILRQSDGTWTYLDDERFSLWNTLRIEAGFESDVDLLFSGPITHLRPSFNPELSECVLEVWAMDGSVLMDREEKLKDWPDKKDSDIAQEIFSDYGFTAEVEDTHVIHDQAISTIIQRETDMQFLKRLALRNGYECYVKGDTGYFRPPQIDAEPQPVLAAHFGPETTLTEFTADVNGLVPVTVSVHQVDRANKEILDVAVEASQQSTLGESGAGDLLPLGSSPGHVVVGQSVATGNPEMSALCQGLYHQGEWFVTGEGVVAANVYGHVLKPRRTVTLKGVGETYSGVYYVTHVTHVFDREGYRQNFRVKRNAIRPSGLENFESSAELAVG